MGPFDGVWYAYMAVGVGLLIILGWELFETARGNRRYVPPPSPYEPWETVKHCFPRKWDGVM